MNNFSDVPFTEILLKFLNWAVLTNNQKKCYTVLN